LGEYLDGDRRAAEIGATILGKRIGVSPEEFSTRTKRAMEKGVGLEIVKKLILEEMGECDFEENSLWSYLVQDDTAYMDVDFDLEYPVVGIGAPVDAFLPQVAGRLGTEYLSVDHYEVGNAVGAVTTGVIGRVEMIVAKDHEEGHFVFITPAEREVSAIRDEEEAMEYGKKKAKRMAIEAVEEAGGEDVEIHVERERFLNNSGDIVVVGIGSPITG
jgi:N-methylhydantoinase A/oxoprolinase/acetone carboxylase beta subunit